LDKAIDACIVTEREWRKAKAHHSYASYATMRKHSSGSIHGKAS
jgi:hypothetical protein